MPRDERPGKKPYGSRGRRPRGSLRRIPCVVETNGEPAMKKRAFLYLSSGAQNQPGLKQARPWCHARRGKANTPNSGFLPITIFRAVRKRLSEAVGRELRGAFGAREKANRESAPGPAPHRSRSDPSPENSRKKCPRTFRRVRGHNRSKFPVSSRNVRARGSSGRAEHPRRRTEVSDGRPVRIEEENRLPTKRRTCLKLPIYGVNATVFRRRKYSHTFLSLVKRPHDFDIFP